MRAKGRDLRDSGLHFYICPNTEDIVIASVALVAVCFLL